ncbi:LrgB family protein [Nocardioides sp. zg-536]|uniref:LrgB family protein n=1 Tax=Nocardioides faecalis TaxID=2803858 RepID=A0A938Y840_9ACTN|nr:LrgB family protein [Nocardioides faecalis]MBM9460964.1 LrgB family protein [Nocardioides faecalis]MBS4751955.1 LrgB family protein [Nocardioides faecalis]QVI59213.1 LrgB family protein [Nocardioides faecalis]
MSGLAEAGEAVLEVLRSPLGLLALTLGGYQLGRWLQRRTGGHALAQPVLVCVVVVAVAIGVLGVEYPDYRRATELIAFWLGPATVALAIPLHRQAARLRGFVVPMLVAIIVGAVVSIVSAVLLARALGAGDSLERTLGTKAATTPVAIAVSESLGGIGPLAAVFAIIIGIVGAIAGPALLDLARVRDRRARGLAVGAVSHGVGASRMLREDETEGAFAGLGMGLTALAISVLVPLLALLLF